MHEPPLPPFFFLRLPHAEHGCEPSAPRWPSLQAKDQRNHKVRTVFPSRVRWKYSSFCRCISSSRLHPQNRSATTFAFQRFPLATGHYYSPEPFSIHHTPVGYPHLGDSNFRFQTRWSWACSFQRPTLDLGMKEVQGASALP